MCIHVCACLFEFMYMYVRALACFIETIPLGPRVLFSVTIQVDLEAWDVLSFIAGSKAH